MMMNAKYICKSLKKNNKIFEIFRLCSTDAEKKIKKPRRITKSTKEVETYLSSNINLSKIKDEIPEKLRKKYQKPRNELYLIDRDVGHEIANVIYPHVIKSEKNVIETNPGFGFITNRLIQQGLEAVYLYEPLVSFHKYCLKLQKESKAVVDIIPKDFFSVWSLAYQDRYDNGTRVKDLLLNIETRDWNDPLPFLTIIGVQTNTIFIRHLIISLIFQFGISAMGRCELFLIIPPFVYHQLTANSKLGYMCYRQSSVLFQVLFDYEILLKVPRECFLPWDNVYEIYQHSKIKKLYSVDSDKLYVTRIEFKRNPGISMEKLQHFWFFVQQTMLSRNNCVIPFLEKWIPGSGLRLITKNNQSNLNYNPHIFPDINIYTEIGQMNPHQILHLYLEFSSWPEYNECTFIPSMETQLLKMTNTNDLEDESTLMAVKNKPKSMEIEDETKLMDIEDEEKMSS